MKYCKIHRKQVDNNLCLNCKFNKLSKKSNNYYCKLNYPPYPANLPTTIELGTAIVINFSQITMQEFEHLSIQKYPGFCINPNEFKNENDSNNSKQKYNIGNRVSYYMYGDGTIIEIDYKNNLLTVEFDKVNSVGIQITMSFLILEDNNDEDDD